MIGLSPELVELLHEHHTEQDRERALATQLWTDHGWVFTTPTGAPLDPRTDWTANAGRSMNGRPGALPDQLAVAVGFEPTDACTSHAFEACSFGRSDTLPPSSLSDGPVDSPP